MLRKQASFSIWKEKEESHYFNKIEKPFKNLKLLHKQTLIWKSLKNPLNIDYTSSNNCPSSIATPVVKVCSGSFSFSGIGSLRIFHFGANSFTSSTITWTPTLQSLKKGKWILRCAKIFHRLCRNHSLWMKRSFLRSVALLQLVSLVIKMLRQFSAISLEISTFFLLSLKDSLLASSLSFSLLLMIVALLKLPLCR